MVDLICGASLDVSNKASYLDNKQELRCRAVITVHVGQCGIQCATAVWDLIQSEHGVDKSGHVSSGIEGNTLSTCFRESSSGRWYPRTILVDLEPSVIDAVRASSFKQSFASCDMINEYEDAASCYARGRYVVGLNAIYETRQRLRCQLECTDNCTAIISNCSTSGGTGSGLLPDIVTIDDGKRSYSSIGIKVYPSRDHDNTLSYYNTCLHTNAMNDLIDFNILVDNAALCRVAESSIFAVRSPPNTITFKHLNEQIAQIFSGITCGERKLTASGMDINRFQTCLVPYPGLAQIGVTIAAYQEPGDREQNVRTLMKDAFGELTSCTINRSKGAYMSSFILFRGTYEECHVHKVVAGFNLYKFVPWVPTRYTLASCIDTPHASYPCTYELPKQTIMHMWNHTAIGSVLAQHGAWIGVSYTKKSFLHWYTQNGMREAELEEAMQSGELLKKVYESIGNLEKPTE